MTRLSQRRAFRRLEVAQAAEALLARFPNASVNADEPRRLRAALYPIHVAGNIWRLAFHAEPRLPGRPSKFDWDSAAAVSPNRNLVRSAEFLTVVTGQLVPSPSTRTGAVKPAQ
jgi:hypothetical protein